MRRALFATVLSVSGALACAAIWGFQDLQPGAADAAPDAAVREAGADGPSCDLDHPPPPPDASGSTTAKTFVLALDRLDFGINVIDGGVAVNDTKTAYDLDDVCTCQAPNQESCKRDTSKTTTCDDSRGRDDVGRSLLQQLQGPINTTAFTNEGALKQINAGRMNLLIGIQGYAGSGDAKDIQVALVPSIQIESPPKPKFDGNDTWTYEPTFGFASAPTKIGAAGANKGATRAYVSGGQLVAYFSDIVTLIQLDTTNGNPLTVHITDGVVTANVVPSGASFELDKGRISGRWSSAALLRAVSVWDLSGTPPLSGPFCPGTFIHDQITSTICRQRDINTRASDPATQACDAMSFSLGFHAKPALAGGPSTYPYQPTACFDGGVATTVQTSVDCDAGN